MKQSVRDRSIYPLILSSSLLSLVEEIKERSRYEERIRKGESGNNLKIGVIDTVLARGARLDSKKLPWNLFYYSVAGLQKTERNGRKLKRAREMKEAIKEERKKEE